MTIQHSVIPDADLHETKGAAGAAAGKVPLASGAGTAPFNYVNPLGSIYFIDYAAPYILAYPAAYTKLAPATTAAGVSVETTEGNNARVTYTGAITSKFRVVCNMTISQTVGANRDLGFKLYKNGVAVAGSEIFQTSTSGVLQLLTTIFDVSLAQNDYVECFVQNKGASGDINVHSYMLNIIGIRG